MRIKLKRSNSKPEINQIQKKIWKNNVFEKKLYVKDGRELFRFKTKKIYNLLFRHCG